MAAENPALQRSTTVTVFGVLNILYGLFCLLGNAFSALMIFTVAGMPIKPAMQPEYSSAMLVWQALNIALSTIACLALIAAGIGLLMLRPWGRTVSFGYAIYAPLAMAANLLVFGVIFGAPMFQEGHVASGQEWATLVGVVFGAGFNCIYPLLLWYFLTRPQIVPANERISTSEEWMLSAAATAPRAESGNPFVSPTAESPTGGARPPGTAESVVDVFVPSKNGPALAAYYLGLFSLFPCLGFPLGVAAVYYGLQGQRRVRENPAVRGGAHAWVGIVCGALFGLFNFLLVIATVIVTVAAAMQGKR